MIIRDNESPESSPVKQALTAIASFSGVKLYDALSQILSSMFGGGPVFICLIHHARESAEILSQAGIQPPCELQMLYPKPALFNDISNGSEVSSGSENLLDRNGKKIFKNDMQMLFFPLLFEAGGSAGFAAVGCPDISVRVSQSWIIELICMRLSRALEQKIIKQNLREKFSYLKNLLSSSPDIILTLNEDLVITDRFTSIDKSVLPYDQVVGRNISEIFPQETYRHIKKIISRDDWSSEYMLEYSLIRNGKLLYRQALIRKIENHDNVYMMVVRDQTEKKHSEKLKEDINRIMRHDLKNPLNIVSGMTQLLLRENPDPEDRKILEIIYDESIKILKMTDQALRIFRMEEGLYNPEMEVIDAGKLFEYSILSTKEISSMKNSEVFVNGKSLSEIREFPSIKGEKILLENMFSNLLRNALEASPSGQPVNISFESSDEQHTFTFHNMGMIPEEIQPHFFEPYITGGKQTGTGLGTYSALLSAKTLGGDIQFRTSDAEGTFITVHLPV